MHTLEDTHTHTNWRQKRADYAAAFVLHIRNNLSLLCGREESIRLLLTHAHRAGSSWLKHLKKSNRG